MGRTARNYTPQEKQILVRIGHRVVQARKGLRWTQETLAEQTGLTPSHISKIERAAYRDVHFMTLYRVCQALGLSLDSVVDEVELPVDRE